MTIYEIEELNFSKGFHWFNVESMKMFKSKVYEETFDLGELVYFISSEVAPMDKVRKYTIRSISKETGRIGKVGGFMAFDSKSLAIKTMRSLGE